MTDTHFLPTGHEQPDTHSSTAGGEPLPATPTKTLPTPTDEPSGSQPHLQPPAHGRPDTHSPAGGWLELRVWAEMFHDAQQARIAQTNRAERAGVDPAIYQAHIDSLTRAEHQCRLALRRCYRRVTPEPIRTWQTSTHGLGEDLMARLLGHLGHPRWATPHHWEGTGTNRTLIADPPHERTVSQLWAYTGHGRPGRPQKGATAADLAALGNPTLKMLVHLIAECTMKQKASPFRLVYEETRTAYTDRTHSAPCVRCGPSGAPAQIGSPWSPGHQHAAALRKVGKEILRDLWQVSR